MVQRQCSLSTSAKWDNFKKQRDLQVDRYTKLKRKMLWVKFIVTIIKCQGLILRLRKNFRDEIREQKIMAAKRFIGMRGAILWRVRQKKFGQKMLRDQH